MESAGEASVSDKDDQFYREHAKDFIELHNQITTSVDLLDSLESFLATFQGDLTAVSGQISDLQARSKEFDSRLHGRKKIERPLSQLISDLSIPPTLVTALLDTPVGEPWIALIEDFEQRLQIIKSRSRVKAARDLTELVEGLRIAAATKIRAFFNAMMQPIRTNISTNMNVLQTSVFLKYAPLYAFLQRQAKPVAQEIQRAYIGCAKLYYETGFRRYTRNLGYIKLRTVDKQLLIGDVTTDQGVPTVFVDVDRIPFAKLDGPNITLAYMADDKAHKAPVEALLRSALMVLLDNASAEYSFIVKFFREPPVDTSLSTSALKSPMFTPVGSSTGLGLGDRRPSGNGSESEGEASGVGRGSGFSQGGGGFQSPEQEKEHRNLIDGIWRQIMNPAIQYCQTFITSALEPIPPVVPLLTMIRINEAVYSEAQKRECVPLETLLIGLRLTMWPIFQKEMTAHVDSLKKLVDGAGAGYLSRGTTLKDSWIQLVVQRYSAMFTAFTALAGEEEEAMLFTNLSRLRQEVIRLITTQAGKLKDPAKSAAYLSTTYEIVLHNLSSGPHSTTHPKAQVEAAFWHQREEEARRRMTLTQR
ncbi:hypothetical protein FRB95_013845 [Tulasnella sp. JGI-2019a]|nr:hypothetical protein FRB93_007455 [Tulasnella sp. JGI-2019a]KAG9034076.1 hypothetical protein FRB95_013845 [Tulasnella sp. JGI-2019a]